jgi:hypothetical protein
MATRPISRRALLVAIGSVGLSIPVLGLLSLRRRRHVAVVAAIVQQRLSSLRCDDSGVSRFAEDFIERLSPADLKRLSLVATLYPAYPHYLDPSSPVVGPRVARLESELLTSFLLGSDLFRAGGGDRQAVRYVGYFDPYSMICGNPFARFDEQ